MLGGFRNRRVVPVIAGIYPGTGTEEPSKRVPGRCWHTDCWAYLPWPASSCCAYCTRF
jgi:hypothetical protein